MQLEPPGSEDTLDHTSEGPSCHRNRGHMEAQRGNPEIFLYKHLFMAATL